MKKRNQLIQGVFGVGVTEVYHGLEKIWWEIEKNE